MVGLLSCFLLFLHLSLLRCDLFPTPFKTLILIALQEVRRPVVVYLHKGWEHLRTVSLIVMRAAVALRVLNMRAGKGGRGGGLRALGVCWDYAWKNTGWCPGKSWEDVAVPVHRDIKARLKKTLNPFKTLNCEHYF